MAREAGGVILLFGGTTEGRQAAALLDRRGLFFIYSTKTLVEPFASSHGEFRHGALDEAALEELVTSRVVRIVIDAAHPFAARLHASVFEVCQRLAVRLIRFDRAPATFPESDGLHSVADFTEALALLDQLNPGQLLALTGVQSARPLRLWWERREMLLRILPSPASMAVARREGFPEAKLLPMSPDGPDEALETLVRGAWRRLPARQGERRVRHFRLEAAGCRTAQESRHCHPPPARSGLRYRRFLRRRA